MRILALCSLVIAVVFAFDARTTAKAAAWCAAYDNGSTNCGFYTYEQCRAGLSGVGGSCSRNPAESGAKKPAARKAGKAERKPNVKKMQSWRRQKKPRRPPLRNRRRPRR